MYVIIHWISNKKTLDYIELWEQLNNENFNFTEFREIKNKKARYLSFTLNFKSWIDRTNLVILNNLKNINQYLIATK